MKLVASSDLIGTPTVALRWCLVSEEIQYLKDNNISDPYILLVIVNNKKEVDRKLIPVNKLMTYISFRHAGENTIFATIVWPKVKFKRFLNYYIGKSQYGYNHNFYSHNFYSSAAKTLIDTDGYGLDAIAVNVSPDFFAPEPAEWEKWWVNLWFETKPKDQCQFRKRRILAYTIQPLLVLLFIVIVTIFRILAALFWLMVRTRTGVSLRAIWRPFYYQSDDVWYKAQQHGRNVYLKKRDGTDKSWVINMFHPVAIILTSVLLWMGNTAYPQAAVPVWGYPLLGIALLLVSLLAIHIIYFIVVIILALLTALEALVSLFPKGRVDEAKKAAKLRRQREKEAQAAAKKKAKQAALQAKLAALEKEFAAISCDDKPPIPRLAALPKEKRTIHLRFLDIKARVCKPYAS